MFQCPNCGHRQVRTPVQRAVFWICARCRGRIATLGLLRRLLDGKIADRYWRHARRTQPSPPARRPCPGCRRAMREVTPAPAHPTVDVCVPCQLFWFDPREYDVLPARDPDVSPSQPPPVQKRRRRRAVEMDDVFPAWQWMCYLVGLPMEIKTTSVRRAPLATYTIALLIAALGGFWLSNLRAYVEMGGLVPAEWNRDHGLTLLTSFFLHGGLGHLAGNLYFLLAFGDNVEDYLGRVRYVALVAAAHLCGNLAYILMDPDSTIPAIGASAGISGIIVFYGLRFRRAEIALPVLRFFAAVVSVWWALIAWLVLQGLLLILEHRGESAIAASAHLGGALVGVIAWALDRAANRLTIPARTSDRATSAAT